MYEMLRFGWLLVHVFENFCLLLEKNFTTILYIYYITYTWSFMSYKLLGKSE